MEIADKVIVEVQLDFSEESDKTLRTLFEVAEELLDKHNIWVEIVPTHIWFTDPLEVEMADLPKVFINGKLRFIGRTPTKKELVEAILSHVGLPAERSKQSIPLPSRVTFDGGFPEVALA